MAIEELSLTIWLIVTLAMKLVVFPAVGGSLL